MNSFLNDMIKSLENEREKCKERFGFAKFESDVRLTTRKIQAIDAKIEILTELSLSSFVVDTVKNTKVKNKNAPLCDSYKKGFSDGQRMLRRAILKLLKEDT